MRLHCLLSYIILSVSIGLLTDQQVAYANSLKVSAVKKLLSIKCSNNLNIKYKDCYKGITSIVDLLDFEKNDDRLALVFYKNKFVKLLSDKKLKIYFEESLKHISNSSREYSFDLWSYTDKFIRTNQLQIDTNTMLAILLQDNAKLYQVYWLKSQKEKNETLSQNTYYYEEWVLTLSSKSEFYNYIEFYPPSVRSLSNNFNKKPYYFYMPWLMAKHILEIKELPRSFQVFPLYISFIYKLHHHYHNYYSVLLKKLPRTAVIIEDELCEIEKGWSYRYRDLYMAYLGNKLVVQSSKTIMKFSKFRKHISNNPQKLFREIFL